jgi:2-polyprenyl-3-methyl-5-hydroxy-6-metoxy-1,4-benzoquinol methylase
MVAAVDEDPYGTRKRLAFASALICAARPRNVLDFGCGTGLQLTMPLAAKFPEVRFLGVDADATSIDFAKTHCTAPNLSFALAAPHQGERYDVIIASEVIEHLEAPGGFLRELESRLQPRGRVLLTVPNGYGPFELASLAYDTLEAAGLVPLARSVKRALFGAASARPPDTHAVSPHVNFFSLGELRRAIASAGMKVAEFRARTVLCGFGFDYLIRGRRLTAWNAALADRLPPQVASDWMFVLERTGGAPGDWEYRPGAYARLRRSLGASR